MTEYEDLASPPVAGLDARGREYLSYELTVVTRRIQRRRDALRTAAQPGLEAVITELDALAYVLSVRAHAYRHQEDSHV